MHQLPPDAQLGGPDSSVRGGTSTLDLAPPAIVGSTTDGESIHIGKTLILDDVTAAAIYLETVGGSTLRFEPNGNFTAVVAAHAECGASPDRAYKQAWFGADCEWWTIGDLPPISIPNDPSPILGFVVVPKGADPNTHYLSAHFESRLEAITSRGATQTLSHGIG